MEEVDDPANLHLGARLHAKFNIIDFHLQGEERWRHIEVSRKVIFNISLPDRSHKIGIGFERISAEDKLLITGFVKRNKISSG